MNTAIVWHRAAIVGVALLCLTSIACSRSSLPSSPSGPNVEACAQLSGAGWAPQVAGVSSSNHDASVQIEESVLTVQGPLSGIETPPKLVEVRIPMETSLGEGGSLSLIAEASAEPRPGSAAPGVVPVLVSLHDGKDELLNLKESGETGCGNGGLFCCTGAECRENPAWNTFYPSMYANRDQWEQHQINPFANQSVNTVPTCRWSVGASGDGEKCLFSDPEYFPNLGLRSGKDYRARYALIAVDSLREPGGMGTLKVTLLKKFNKAVSTAGAVDLNVVLVGNKNIADSRTKKGQQNLNLLMSQIQQKLSQPGVGIKIGRIQVLEWDCEQGGDAYANLSDQQLSELFRTGSQLVPSQRDHRALNLFMVSTISGVREGFTVLGVAGGIGGPMISGTAASGLAFSSFNRLASYNPLCSGEGDCSMDRQQSEFVELGVTISHEIGHFLGLNHPSESDGRRHDALPDTPVCSRTERLSMGNLVTPRSCWQDTSVSFPATGKSCQDNCPSYDGRSEFCPEAVECQFNHLMWWTSKSFVNGRGDGNLLSADSSAVLHYNPLVY